MKALVTKSNFFRLIEEKGYDALPAQLQTAFVAIAKRTNMGKDWSEYNSDADFKLRCNMTFKKLRSWINGKYVAPEDQPEIKPEWEHSEEAKLLRIGQILDKARLNKTELRFMIWRFEQRLKQVPQRSPYREDILELYGYLVRLYNATEKSVILDLPEGLSFHLHLSYMAILDKQLKLRTKKYMQDRENTMFGLAGNGFREDQEVVLSGAVPKIDIPEIKVRYNRSSRKEFEGRLSSSLQVANFIRKTFIRGEIEVQEQFIVLYLDRANNLLGYYKHAKGGISGVFAETRLILAVALRSLASSIIISHNHPSGNKRPSQPDIDMTKRLREAARQMDIEVLDHIIVTREGYYSFVDEGLLGLPEPTLLHSNEARFLHLVDDELRKGTKVSGVEINRLAKRYEISDRTQLKELLELAIVRQARYLAHLPMPLERRYELIVNLYHNQVTLSHRTSQSILLQQYSTPVPIGFLMGIFCGIDKLDETGGYAYEPCAGNGSLTIAARPERVYVNEIDILRNRNLQTQGFANVFSRDALSESSYLDIQGSFPAVITNPPFGRLDKGVMFDSFRIRELDHVMAIRALSTMTTDGRAAIIIGGHTVWDKLGRVQAGKNRIFFNHLYHYYNVVDVIPINGHKLYSRQGTAFPTRLILIDGRKETPEGAAPLKQAGADKVADSFAELFERIMQYVPHQDNKPSKNAIMTKRTPFQIKALEAEAASIMALLSQDELGMLYTPASQSCFILDTHVPDAMGAEIHAAMKRIKAEVGGDIDNFVRHRLGYKTKDQLCKALSAEQIDAVAMAIYNIEGREQGTIIGDQTGIGKGRVAAAMIRYAVKQGLKPVFITEKANLFSDIYRDLVAIGSGNLRPFIINGRESKTDIKDEDGTIVYQALGPSEQSSIFKTQRIPLGFDFAVATYSQFNSKEKKPEKPYYLSAVATDNILILDESHNASGSSNTGEFMRDVVRKTKGVVFLSATFAKRPDNMPIYASKTSISDASLTQDALVDAISKGGVALQEIISSQLVSEGQMIRRERSFEGIEVNYITLDELEQKHTAISDSITGIMRQIIDFQTKYVNKQVEQLDAIKAKESKSVAVREGTQRAGADNLPYFSKVFNVINQMLFSIKAEAVADRAIMRLKEGKKPVIAFASTMGSFIEQMETPHGMPVGDGDLIDLDFSMVLRRGLESVCQYTEYGIDGEGEHKEFDLAELGVEATVTYKAILHEIDTVSTSLCISPIDVIIKKLEAAGYSVAEVTGRKFSVQINDSATKGLVLARKKIPANDAFRQFNNNEVDVLMINQSGSTGASAHAIVTPKVSKEEVKQRVMIVLQPELDINTEVQKRGRINRTGQILKPIYDYVVSAIPAEKRLMMLLQQKLKSLDANTTSNQKQSNSILDVPDFLNKYGDKVVVEYLKENPEVNRMLDDPLFIMGAKGEQRDVKGGEDAAHRVSGRVAVLSTKMQAVFYNEVIERYNDYITYLQQAGEYDLEVEALDLKTETQETSVMIMGQGGNSAFGEDSYLEKVKANVLRKPFTTTELAKKVDERLGGKLSAELSKDLAADFKQACLDRYELEVKEADEKYDFLINEVPNERPIRKLEEHSAEWREAIELRKEELESARELNKAMLKKAQESRYQFLNPILKFFHVGRRLNYPISTYNDGKEMALAVSLGVSIDMKKKNPYAPSSMKLLIAICNSMRYMAIPLSNHKDISSIMTASLEAGEPPIDELLDMWGEAIAGRIKDRDTRYIITGNILQAFEGKSGKLISYTTMDGQVKKGILMPEEWEAPAKGDREIKVPILKALPIISSLTNGQLTASGSISVFRSPEGFRFIMPLARSKAGDIYLDPDLFPYLQKNMFEKVSDRMQGIVTSSNLEDFLRVLQFNHGISVIVTERQLSQLNENAIKSSNRIPIVLPPPEGAEDQSEKKRLRLLELEAEALLVMLQIAA